MFIWIQNQFDGLIVGIISGLLVSFLVYVTGKLIQRILLPKEIRQKHSSALSVYRRTLSFTVKAKIDADGDFIVKGRKKTSK